MKTFAIALALPLAIATSSLAQPADTSSRSYGQGKPRRSTDSAGSRIGGQPTNPPERGPASEGRPRAGFDVGVASATAGGRTDTGPPVETSPRGPAAERGMATIEENAPFRQSPAGSRTEAGFDRVPARQAPSLAEPGPEEIREEQRRGRIRDHDEPDAVRGRDLAEVEVPNPFQVEEVLKNPYRHRQDDVPVLGENR
jgi:hypothetical protein